MAGKVFDSVRQLVHDASTALIDNQVSQKMADLATSAVKSGFEIVDDVLGIVKDLSEPKNQQSNP